jgi:hypothetical protein
VANVIFVPGRFGHGLGRQNIRGGGVGSGDGCAAWLRTDCLKSRLERVQPQAYAKRL